MSFGAGVLSTNDADLAQAMADVVDVGATSVRLDVPWPSVEPSPGVLRWANTDRVVAAARHVGLEVTAVIGYTPSWAAAPDDPTVPASPERFGEFVARAAERYRGDVGTWEIWNEPNHPGVFRHPVAATYAPLLAAGAAAVHAGDPGAVVVSGGLSPSPDRPDLGLSTPPDYLDDLLDALGGFPADAVGVHPYSYPAMPSGTEEWNTFHRLSSMRAVLDAHGHRDVGFALTEVGAPTGDRPDAVGLDAQAAIVVDAIDEAHRRGDVDSIHVFAMRDAHAAAIGDAASTGFGLIDLHGRRKPSYDALRARLAATTTDVSATTTAPSTTSSTTTPVATAPTTTTAPPTTTTPTTSAPTTTIAPTTTTAAATTTTTTVQPPPGDRPGRAIGRARRRSR